MRRLLAALAVGAMVALVALVAVLATRPAPGPTAAERAEALARELRCPDCQGLSVADSPTGSAAEIRRQIRDLVASGSTRDEVRAHFVERYGEWILLAPTAPITWALPFVVVAAGAVLLVVLLRRHPASPAPTGRPLPEAERRRLREEAEALDA